MNKDYTIREGKTGENYRQLDQSFSFEKEAAELILPYIDEIITNHNP